MRRQEEEEEEEEGDNCQVITVAPSFSLGLLCRGPRLLRRASRLSIGKPRDIEQPRGLLENRAWKAYREAHVPPNDLVE
jgi:hypothetical protein